MSEPLPKKIGGRQVAEHGSLKQDKDNLSSQPPQPTPTPASKPVVNPPATAKNRADLAETLPWFRKHQGGLYYKDETIQGILLVNDDFGGLGHFRDRVLITRLSRQTNQRGSIIKSVTKAARNTLQHHNMIGVVISKDFQKLPVTFRDDECLGVSGFWHLSTIFAVKSEGPIASEVHTDLMACLVYSGPRESMWWSLSGAEKAANTVKVLEQNETFDDLFTKENCSTCDVSSTTIFQEGWVCTNVECTKIGKNHSGDSLRTQTYLDQILEAWIAPQHLAMIPPPLLPIRSDQIQLTNDEVENSKVMRDHWRGWVCLVCRTMNRRKEYHKLVCSCGQSFTSSPPHVHLDQVVGEDFLNLSADSNATHKSINNTCVQLIQQDFTPMFAAYTWEFSPEARVTALYPRAAAHQGPRGNDKVFEDLQEKMRSGAIQMARSPFVDDKGHKSYTRQFCANFGRQYNPSMDMSTTPFELADPIITELVQRAKAIVLDRIGADVDFNEVLCLAYLPDMAIGWHNDGEADLRDIIVSHSFGANCQMKFAMKGAYWLGKKPTTTNRVVLTPDDPHLRGCLKMNERRALLEKRQNDELTREEYETQLRDVVGPIKKIGREDISPMLLSLVVPHGGYVIMHGKNMQKYYQVRAIVTRNLLQPCTDFAQHSAESNGLMRFVATMRQIGDDHEKRTKVTKRRATSSQQPAEGEPTESLEDSSSTVVEKAPKKQKK